MLLVRSFAKITDIWFRNSGNARRFSVFRTINYFLLTPETEERIFLSSCWKHMRIRGVELWLSSLLNLPLGGGECTTAFSVRFTPGKEPLVPIDWEDEWGPRVGLDFSRKEIFLGPARIPDCVIGIFHWHNPSGRTMALELTQPLTVMSTRNISWGVKAAGA